MKKFKIYLDSKAVHVVKAQTAIEAISNLISELNIPLGRVRKVVENFNVPRGTL